MSPSLLCVRGTFVFPACVIMFMVIFMFVCFTGLPRVQLFCLMVVLQTDVLTMFLLSVFSNVKQTKINK